MTNQSELRQAIEFLKNDSGSGTKSRKQERFREVYEPAVAHIVSGERYDDAGVGPATARSAVQSVYPDLDTNNFDTISEALTAVSGGDNESLDELVTDLDSIARRSGNAQKEYLEHCLEKHREPSLVTLALLDDESIGLGTSEMRDAFFNGTRDERKRREAFTDTTHEFISLAQQDVLPYEPIVGEPFDPMLAVPESRGEPDNPVSQRKLDGYRVLIHVKQEEVGPRAYAFSRARNDVTESLPELNEIDWPNQGEYILDGEVIAENGSYSDTSERIGRKAENVSRDVEMEFAIFDSVVYDGQNIADKPYIERYDLMAQVLHEVDDRIYRLGFRQDIENAKDDAIAADEEGIIVKDLQAPYEFGKRSTYWQKQKLDAETIDVVIGGFYEGDGESTGTLGAVAIESADGTPLGRSGSGFSDAEREEIWENQDEYIHQIIEVEARGLGSQGHLRMPIYKNSRPEGEADSFDRIKEVMKDV